MNLPRIERKERFKSLQNSNDQIWNFLQNFPPKSLKKWGSQQQRELRAQNKIRDNSRQIGKNPQHRRLSLPQKSEKRRSNSGTGEWVHFSRWGFGFEASQGRKTKTMQSLLIFQILARFLKVALCPFPSLSLKTRKTNQNPKKIEKSRFSHSSCT